MSTNINKSPYISTSSNYKSWVNNNKVAIEKRFDDAERCKDDNNSDQTKINRILDGKDGGCKCTNKNGVKTYTDSNGNIIKKEKTEGNKTTINYYDVGSKGKIVNKQVVTEGTGKNKVTTTKYYDDNGIGYKKVVETKDGKTTTEYERDTNNTIIATKTTNPDGTIQIVEYPKGYKGDDGIPGIYADEHTITDINKDGSKTVRKYSAAMKRGKDTYARQKTKTKLDKNGKEISTTSTIQTWKKGDKIKEEDAPTGSKLIN